VIFLKKLLHYLIKLKNRIFLPFVILYILAAALAAYAIEPRTFESYLTSVYWVLTTLATVGFGDYAPVTNAGKAFTILLYVTGIALISVFIGKIIESVGLIERLRVGGKLKFTEEDHIILIGWSNKTKLAIQEILKSDKKINVVLIDKLDESPMIDERVFYINGDAADEATLMQANLPKARGVIIFADHTAHENRILVDPMHIDGKTLLIATAITTLENRLNASIHVTVEVLEQKHIPMFKQVMVDEFIPTQEMISHAAVRSLFSHGVIHMYSELMSTRYAESMYEIPKRPEWRTYRQAFLDLLDQGITLVADRGDLHINQKLDQPIPEDAKLFVICDKETFSEMNPTHFQ
jgi:voltage-gated potassium channel